MNSDVTPNHSSAHDQSRGARVGVVLVAHGDRGGRAETRRNQALHHHTDALTKILAPLSIAAGVLKGTPTFEDALATVHAADLDQLIVYPFFMADGYFVNTKLPERLRSANLACPIHVCPPLGLDAGLPQLIITQTREAAERANRKTASSRLLLVGHGSKFGPASANATREVALKIRALTPQMFAEIEVAFLEETPFLGEALNRNQRPTFVSGFFNGDGLHAGEDVPEAIAATESQALYCGPIGSHPEIPHLIADAVRLARDANVRTGDRNEAL